MSNHLAIATITATIQRTLQSSVQLDVEGARITTVQPGEIGKGTPETGVNLFLYHVITNPALNNLDAISSRSRGNPIRRQVALDLYYMVSFYGNESELEPQRLLGSVVRTLNDKRVFQPEMIRDTCRDVTFSYLQPSTLAEQLQQISISPLDLNLEDLSKAWSVFFQAPYLLSVAYKVLVVLIEGEESSTRALPVRGRMGGLVAFPNTPQVDKIMGQGGLYDPILATSTLLIQGKYLKGDRHTQVRIGGVEVTPTGIKDNELLLPLSLVPEDLLRAGVQSLQVIHPRELGADRGSHQRGAESNAAPFVLRPQVTAVGQGEVMEVEDGIHSTELRVTLNSRVHPDQRVIAVLNGWSTADPQSYLFEALKRDAVSHSIVVPIDNIRSGDYLVRLLVDGAESQLEVDDDPDSPTYEWFIGPRVEIR
jgi:hypothetical protein